MSKVVFSKISYGTFGNCVKLTNGLTELVASLDYGPRILHFSLCGKENMLYNDADKKTLGDIFDVYQGDQLKLYGGHRIWISPEVMPRCYHPDNLPVICTETENGVILKGAVEKYNQIQKIMTITMHPEKAAVTIENEILNTGLWDIEFAPWCITMMDKGGVGVIPVPGTETGTLPNRFLALWDYSDMTDARVKWGKEFITLSQDPKAARAFKLGINNEHGWAAYFNKGQVFIKYFEYDETGLYPDGDSSFESYTNEHFLEMETLGVIQCVMPGDSASVTEDWEIFEAPPLASNDEDEVKKLIKTYIID